MLVLSRKKNESIVINGGTEQEITIVVVEIRGDKVRLGVEAPKEIPVHRREVHEAITRKAAEEEETAVVAKPEEKPDEVVSDDFSDVHKSDDGALE